MIVDGTAIGYVGTRTKLYQVATFSTGSFTDRSKGGGYTAATTDQWCFTQYGNISIATDYVDAVQSRDASGASAFADLAGTPPKARIALTQSMAVVLFNYNDGVNTYSDGWWASDIGDHTTWTPSASNEAANARILQRPGPITAATAFGDEIIVWKASGMFRMKYVGLPLIWVVELISEKAGAEYQGSVCNCGSFLLFTGRSGAYIYDGQLRPIADGFDGSSGSILRVAGQYGQGGLFFAASGAAVLIGRTGRAFVYNAFSDRWGLFTPRDTTGAQCNSTTSDFKGVPFAGDEAAIYALATGVAFCNGGVLLVDLSANPCILRDNAQNDSDTTMTLSGSIVGNERQMTSITAVNVLWTATDGHTWTHGAASKYTGFVHFGDTGNSLPSSTSPIPATTPRYGFDIIKSARFLKPAFSFTHNCEVGDIDVVSSFGGKS